ncbi:hypothetical protein [Epilithonimonas xixisoli]|uniref:Uncharacterized protein n=1 Tax=Epilithonimonas xixisoli TaxID=1476462 RepID=A0A4R8IB73_9FLAO|nr:hypothetical protein [Epilithonimonas xixisoli]TDX87297.1 hypothetical protein B0I22_1485 [Epilithonimonas xixisoli]
MKTNIYKTYYFVSAIFGISVLLNFFDWQLRGYYTEKAIAWIWILFTLAFIIGFWKSRKIKIYFFLIVVLLILSLLPMLLPFYAMVFYLTDTEDYQQIKIDNQFRLETTRHHPMSKARVYIYENHFGLFEKNIARPDYQEIITQTLSTKNHPDLTPIQNVKIIAQNSDSIGLEYQINGHKKLIYHPIKNVNDGY